METLLQKLKLELAGQLCSPHNLQTRPGLRTGDPRLDEFLLWKGLPKGELSLFAGPVGLGSTSLWVETAQNLIQQKRWVAWVQTSPLLFPPFLYQRRLDFSRLFCVCPPQLTSPEREKRLFWILQELISSQLFDLIGCDLSKFSLKTHQIRKLARLARAYQVALVFFLNQHHVSWPIPLFALVLRFQKEGLLIVRALHRPSPHLIPRRWSYAHLVPEFTKAEPSFGG